MARFLAALVVSLATSALVAQQPPPLLLSQLTWFGRDGKRLTTVGPLADHGNIELSPDRARVAVAVLDRAARTRDLWIYDMAGTRTRLTSDPADENWLVWSADGARVVFNAFGPAGTGLVESAADAAAPRRSLISSGAGGGHWPVSLAPDGRHLLYVTNSRATSNDIWVLDLQVEGGAAPSPYLATEASENWAAFSPDGRWVAFSSTEAGGLPEVYVAPFPATGRKWRVSVDGGSQARWRRDGREIVYLAPDRTLMSASIATTAGEVHVEGFEALFQVTFPYGAYHAFDVSADGQRVLVNSTVVSQRGTTTVASR